MRSIAERGFSLIELLVATAIVMGGCLVFFQLAASGQRIARAQPDAADLQQRTRVAVDAIRRDVLRAGAGVEHGAGARPLIDLLPPIVPARTGARRADPELSFFTDRLSLFYAADGAAAAGLSMDMPGTAADVPVDTASPGCPSSGLCGFVTNTRSLVVHTTSTGSGFDVFSVQGIAGGLAHGPPDPGFSRAYPKAGTRVLAIVQRVYYLDAATNRLMVYDGYQSDVPLVENVVSLRFEYFVDPDPSSAPRPPDGESNCAYAPGSPPAPLLASLGDDALVKADGRMFTDGPVCGVSPNRFDADLLRVRRVRATIGLRAQDDGGAGRDGSRIPTVEVSVDVTPRTLMPGR